MQGWISLHRKIQENWLWEDKPFSKGQAWLDLLLMVNHEDKKIMLGNELIEVKRGSRITSIRYLCDRWGWSNTKVKNFLNLLQNDNMIVVKSDTKKTTLTVVNYNDYQVTSDNKNDTETTRERHESDTKATRKHTNNNDNNDNKDIYSAFFEDVWQLYPNKKGKGQISNTKKKEIFKLGEEFERCISRYIKDVEERRKSFPELKYQNGSTFFNSGYIDFLDENYTEKIEVKKEPPKKFVPRFVDITEQIFGKVDADG